MKDISVNVEVDVARMKCLTWVPSNILRIRNQELFL